MNSRLSRLLPIFFVLVLAVAGVTAALADPISVTLVGDMQSELGCSVDWDPACATTNLVEQGYGVWRGEFTLPAGDWQYKMTLDGTWDVSYPGDNKLLSLGAESSVRFYYDDKTHAVLDSVNDLVAVAAGTLQDELGCSGEWLPACVNTLLTDVDGDGIYSFITVDLPVGDYEFKVALNEAWDISYPGDNVLFSVPAVGDQVTITYDSATNDVSVSVDAPPPPGPASVAIAGSLQSELGCPGDWDPACAATHLGYDADDDVWQAIFNVPAGAWEYKAALNDSWDENYGAGAQFNGPNITLDLSTPTDVKFYYDHKSHWVTDNVNSVIATAAGNFQSGLGCPGDWQPECLRSWLQDIDGDTIYTFVTDQIPVGDIRIQGSTRRRLGCILSDQ